MPQLLADLVAQRDRLPVVHRRVWWSNTKRGPGRSRRDSRHSKGARTLRARLSKRIRGRHAAERAHPVRVPLGRSRVLVLHSDRLRGPNGALDP